MKIIVEKDYESISKMAGKIFIEAIAKKPDIILGLATGSTPIGMYKEMIRAYKEEGLDFSKVKTFNLDEYVGLSPEHLSSYRYFMNNELFNHININKENTHVPNGNAENVEEYCKKYDEMIKEAGGIDIQVLGIGQNGHIAFNEPDDSLSVGTNIVQLAENTIKANSRFFDSIEEVPKAAITMGIGSIFKARKILLLASGKNKAPIIKKLLNYNKVTTQLPASFLLLHSDVTIIADEEAYNG
ncbi:glucosamine-6-phosphate deaminase [Tissierella praeacuta]|uniref:glucosamine-6-phosphate deaminase n=1 Tax=Tissierella praeacuta TaxID=43131 RepID=UPI00333E5F25